VLHILFFLTLGTVLGLEDDQSIEYGVRHCQEMSNIMQRLVNDGKQDLIFVGYVLLIICPQIFVIVEKQDQLYA